MKVIEGMTSKLSPIKRGMSFSTLVIIGHLFDTKFFNITVDILEKNNVKFRVIEWEIGNDAVTNSQVTLQLLASDHGSLDNAIDMIESASSKLGIEIQEGQGPEFTDNVDR